MTIPALDPLPGSSPLARGLRARRRRLRGGAGIIPARAGFTSTRVLLPWLSRDHPRSRGVYWMGVAERATKTGSSPLARGLLGGAWIGISPARIIPARAGFTGPRRRRTRHAQDHPRSRGVYSLSRGGRVNEFWIIPARAGFTNGALRCSCPMTDHPRSRGVYTSPAPLGGSTGGSSPLARGLQVSRG